MSESRYAIYKKLKFVVIILIAVIYIIGDFIYYNLNLVLPVKVDNYFNSVNIETPNHDDTYTKKLTYRTIAKNVSKKPVDFRIIYTKNDSDEWYPYFDILPEEHITEVFHLEPNEYKEFNSKIIINSTDDRLITSLLSDIQAKVDIVKSMER
jgi:hypothetical protein